MRATIDFGIDLGTTNSAIAMQRGLTTELLTNEEGPLLSSVIYAAADGSFLVGKAALGRRLNDPMNVLSEFKRLMGTGETLAAGGRRFAPVELSAKVLEELMRRAEQRNGEALQAAVITIPAMFQVPQWEATSEAAKLAGLRYAPLLQEPIAAAIASVGSAELREGYWLVYDLGGGTFDVSLVRSRSGRLHVLDHDGDNHLGGKDFDRLLSRRAADLVREEGKLGDFRRSDSLLAPAFERLKAEAERVRIALSSADSAQFRVDPLMTYGPGANASVSFRVTRPELEALIRPTIERTIKICRQMLERNGLAPSELKRLVLVGGPTLTPCLPEIIESDLNVEARHYVDPSQAVAIGAAIYASTQRVPSELRGKNQAAISIELSYESMTNDPHPLVAGQLVGQLSPGNWTVNFSSEEGGYSSGTIPVRGKAFVGRVDLRPDTLNAFTLNVLHDGTAVVELTEQFSIIHGTTVAKPVLSQSVGVALADNSVRWYLRKGVVLPARQTVSHATTLGLRRGQSGCAVNVPLIQGENDFADRNTIVGVIEINAENLSRDLPAGSEVVVTMALDEHSATTAEAFVPLLNQRFRHVAKFGLKTRTSEEIGQGVKEQRDRLAELQKMAEELGDSPEDGVDSRVEEIESLLEEGGADERAQADQLLHRITVMIDSAQTKGQEQSLQQRFAQSEQRLRSLLREDDRERWKLLNALVTEFQTAIARADLRLAEAKYKALEALEWSVLRELPQFWMQLFEHWSDVALKGPHSAEARIPIDDGKAAINKNDLQGLIRACRALIQLLPEKEKTALPNAILSNVS